MFSIEYILLLIGICVISYCCGSISTAIITCKVMGLPDPRTLGSGNPGATNVLRTGNKVAALITLVGDAVKALLPLLIVKYLLISHDQDWQLPTALAGVSAFVGHIFSVFLKFKGGKGVATAFGLLLGLNHWVFIAAAATWLATAALFRYSALGALVAFALAPIYIWLFTARLDWLVLITLCSVLIFIRHKQNIKNLLNGTESKIGDKKKT